MTAITGVLDVRHRVTVDRGAHTVTIPKGASVNLGGQGLCVTQTFKSVTLKEPVPRGKPVWSFWVAIRVHALQITRDKTPAV